MLKIGVSHSRKDPNHLKNKVSMMSHDSAHLENIYDSKINDPKPFINKSLGKHQINNNLRVFTKGVNLESEDNKSSVIVSKPPAGVFNYRMQKPKQIANNLG